MSEQSKQVDSEINRMNKAYCGKKVEITDKNSQMAGQIGEIKEFRIKGNEPIIRVDFENRSIDFDNHNHLRVIEH